MTAVYSFIAEERANPCCPWSVSELCRVLEVSRSGFYDWESRPPSDRDVSDALLAEEIEAIYVCSAGTYGSPRVHAWLLRQGYQVGHNRVARIIREKGFVGEIGRRKVRTTIADKAAVPSLDLLGRDFNPIAPDQAWAGDITYVATGEGWLFLATVIDLFSRRVIGWALAAHMRADLVCDALKMAIATRGGTVSGVIFHSDRGSQYTSADYRTQAKVGVALDECHAPLIVGEHQVDDAKFAGGHQPQEADLSGRSEPGFEQPGGLGDNRGGDDEFTAVFVEQLGALVVTGLVGVGGADEHAGVDQYGHGRRSEAFGALLVGEVPAGLTEVERLGAPRRPAADEGLESVLLDPVFGRLGESDGEQLGGEVVDADAAPGRLGGEPGSDVVGQVHGHGHDSRVER